MPSVDVGVSRDGLLVGHLGRLQNDVDAVLALQLGHRHLHVKLAGAGEQELLGLDFPAERDGGVLLDHSGDGVADLVLVASRLRFYGKADGRLGKLHLADDVAGRGYREGVARSRMFQLHHGAQVSGPELRHRLVALSLGNVDRAQAFVGSGGPVAQVGVRFDGARDRLHQVDPPGEGIGQSLEDVGRDGTVRRDGEFHLLLRVRRQARHGSPFQGIGEELHHGVHELLHPHVLCCRRAEGGDDGPVDQEAAQPLHQLALGQGALLEVLLHQVVVALRHHLDQLFTALLRLLLELVRNGRFLEVPAAVGFVDIGLLGDQVDDSPEGRLLPQGNLNRDHRPSEGLVDRLQAPLEAGPVPVQLVEHHGPGQPVLFGEFPRLLGLHLHSGHGIDHQQGRVGPHEGGLGVQDERRIPRRVDDVDLAGSPLAVGHSRVDGDLPGNLVIVVVGDRVAVVHSTQAIHRPGRVEHGAGQGGLAGVPMTDQADVADLPAVVNLHERLLSGV